MGNGIGGKKIGFRNGSPNSQGSFNGAYPNADQWIDVFRRAQMPLWLVDVTAVKKSIREITASGVKDFKGWLDSHPEFISRVMSQIQVLELSDMALELAGAVDREEFHRSIDRLVVPESLPTFKTLIMALEQEKPIRDGDGIFRTLDGRIVHTWNQVSFLKSQAGADLLLLAMTDFTRLKQAQNRLATSEERYRMLVETARDMILCHDLEGRLTFVNQAGLDLTGYTREQMIGMDAGNLVPPSLHEDMVSRARKRTSGDSGVFLYETRYRTLDGKEIPVEVSSTLIHASFGEDRMNQVLVVARDISDRKRAEEERRRLEARLRNAQKLESLGVLAAGIAHDFNNYLLAITGSTELLREELPAGTDLDQHLDLIMDAAGSITDLCRQMQLFATAENVESGLSNLSSVVGSLSRLLEVSVAGRAQLNFELEEGLPLARVDESQIGQVVVNLVANAVESMGEQGGVIAIRTGSRDCTGADVATLVGASNLSPGPFVFCEVRDSGCGMDQETATRLFEPFYTTKFVGRGVGLFAAQGIIQKHGGGFQVETRPEQGTTISFLLPAHVASSSDPVPVLKREPTIDRPVDLRGKTVMIVDDQREVRAVAESFLRRFGCRVLVASNGFDAVRVFSQRHPDIDLVLLDLTMEGMDGVATGRRMRTILPAIPIIFASGFNEDVVRQKGASLEPFGILVKPFKKNQLRVILEQMLVS